MKTLPVLKNHIRDPEQFTEIFAVSRETLDRLVLYEALIRRWQKAVNLVARGTLDDIWHRHFADSAQLLALAPRGAHTWLDLGAGGGFPGLVLAILLFERGEARVTLVEIDARKAAFLREVARQTRVRAAVEILSARIENPATQAKVGTADVVVARALAPLRRLLGLAAPFFAPDSVGLFLEGREASSDVESARLEWCFTSELVPSLTEPEAHVAVIRRLKRQDKGAIR